MKRFLSSSPTVRDQRHRPPVSRISVDAGPHLVRKERMIETPDLLIKSGFEVTIVFEDHLRTFNVYKTEIFTTKSFRPFFESLDIRFSKSH